jgi:uncharacterized protein (DUF2062 family)
MGRGWGGARPRPSDLGASLCVLFRRLWEKIKLLWKLAKSERASPREIGWAVGIGAFAGCTPAVGFHGWVAVGLATLFRKNRMFAWIGSRISNMFMLPFIAIAEVQVSHRARTGVWVDIDRAHILEQGPTLLLDWCLGTIPVGLAIAFLCGLLGYAVARRRDTRKRKAAEREGAAVAEREEATPKPSGAQPPSSGSPA